MMKRWCELCGIFGRHVQVNTGQGSVGGVATDITDDGELLIKKGDGEIVKVISGDVLH